MSQTRNILQAKILTAKKIMGLVKRNTTEDKTDYKIVNQPVLIMHIEVEWNKEKQKHTWRK